VSYHESFCIGIADEILTSMYRRQNPDLNSGDINNPEYNPFEDEIAGDHDVGADDSLHDHQQHQYLHTDDQPFADPDVNFGDLPW
jgi:hypothetical protein